jgi:hypothetical protein
MSKERVEQPLRATGITESDLRYFGRRASEEHKFASKASHPSAREAHLVLAGRYRDLAEAMIANASRSAFNDVRASAIEGSHQLVTADTSAQGDGPAFFAVANRVSIVALLRKIFDPENLGDAGLDVRKGCKQASLE